MTKQINKDLVYHRFDVAARIMGWDHIGPLWSPDETSPHKQRANVGRVWLSKAGRANRYEILRMSNEFGGEETVHYGATDERMIEYFDGIIAAAIKFAPEVERAAWRWSSNEVFA